MKCLHLKAIDFDSLAQRQPATEVSCCDCRSIQSLVYCMSDNCGKYFCFKHLIAHIQWKQHSVQLDVETCAITCGACETEIGDYQLETAH